MNALTKITLTLGFAGIAWLWLAPQPEESDKPRTARRQSASAVMLPLPVSSESEPLLPPPVLGESAPAVTSTTAVPVAVLNWQPVPAAGTFQWGRPAEESMMSTWAARDPEGAGRWLNQNRQHPKFADMVRGYAIQVATIDPAASRKWAAQIPEGQNRFGRGGTLEQHIDAVEEMLKGPAAKPPDATPAGGAPPKQPLFMADYTPVLVRQHPDEDPVVEMQPVNPFG